MRPHRNGFTLIELLVVIGISGVLITMGGILLIDLRDTSRARELQGQVSGDLERARQLARRYGVTYRISIDRTTGAYTIVGIDASNAVITTNPPPSIGGSINSTGTFLTDSATVIELTGPFGKLSAAPNCILMQLKNTNRIAQINLVGVTGNVVTREIRKGGVTTCA